MSGVFVVAMVLLCVCVGCVEVKGVLFNRVCVCVCVCVFVG